MEVSGERHAPAALYPPGKDSQYPLDRKLGGHQSRSGHRGYRKIILPLPGIEPRSPSRPVRSQDTILSYPASLSFLLVYKNYNSAFHSFTREPLSILNIQKLSGINILAMMRLLSEQYSLQPYSYPFDTVDVELLGRKALWCCST
jgi:hypothetical protein